MIQVVDRVPTYPNRIRIKHEDGSTELVTWERADEPTVEGTPINKALFDSIAADIGAGLSANKTVYVSTAGSDVLGDGSSTNPYATITKALGSLPKNLNGYTATINIAAGTYNEDVTVSLTYGGMIVLGGAANASVQIRSLRVWHDAIVQVVNIDLAVTGMADGNAISVTNAKLMCLSRVTTTGSVSNGVYLNHNAYAMFSDLSVSNTTYAAVYAVNTSRFFAINIAGNGNTANGLLSVYGAKIAYNSMTLVSNVQSTALAGGRIYSGAQTEIPKY